METADARLSRQEITELGDEIARTSSALSLAEHRFLTLVRTFDAEMGWARFGATSCAAWLSWRCSMGTGASRERLRVARALGELPIIDAAFAAGELSYSKVRALTRVAGSQGEETLLEMARLMTAAQLEKLCRMLRAGRAEAAGEEPERFFRQRGTESGMVRLSIQVTAEEAATITRALDVSAEAPSKRAEGLVALCEEALRGDAPQKSPSEVMLHVDAGTLMGETEEGAGLSAETCRRILCDCGLVAVLEDERGRTLDVGRKTRSIPASIKRALHMRDKGCRFPGCQNQLVDGHHIEHWGELGETKLENLVSLCRRHHRFVHEEGGKVKARVDGTFEFRDADGRVLEEVPEPAVAKPVSAETCDAWALMARNTDPGPVNWEWVYDAAAHAMGQAG